MTHQRLPSPNWTLLLVCSVAIGVLACANDPKRNDNGSGGQGSGGIHLGGSGGGGTGGAGLGGSTAAGGIDSGAQPGVGGSNVPGPACTSDVDCVASGQFCEKASAVRRCVQCVRTSDCSAGLHCRGNECKPVAAACATSLQCMPDKVCDTARGLCVQCASDADCIAIPGQTCVANTCVSATPTCQTSLDCNSQVCDPTSKKCVDCIADGDCNLPGATTGPQHCIRNVCKPECTSDKQCTPEGMLCDLGGLKVCVQCKTNAECPLSAHCAGGQCKADMCDSTEAMCVGNGVARCNAAGTGWGAVENCPSDKPCKALGGAAACGGPTPPVDGGVVTIDGGAGDGPNVSCTTATANPCTGIPRYDGVQTVDGKDDDMCQVPLFVLIKPGAAIVNNYNSIQDSEFPIITARIAWSTTGLHTFFDVTDPNVQSVFMRDPGVAAQKPYQGDSIELFFTSNDTATGAPGGDAGAVHVTLAATGPSLSVKTTNTNGIRTDYAELPATQYKSGKTSNGYAIEAIIPWTGGAPIAGGKVRFDLAVNIADNNCSGVDDMRDAQMVLYQNNPGGQTSCPGGAEAWCDDRTWCSSTLLQ